MAKGHRWRDGLRDGRYMFSDGEKRTLLAAWVGLGVVIGSVVLALALSSLVSKEANTILLIVFAVYLVWLADHSSGATARLRKWYAGRRERDFYRRRMSSVIDRRIETVLKDVHSLTSGEGSVEKLAERFFERPSTTTAPSSGHPLLGEVLPDFYQVRDLIIGDERLLSISFYHLGSLNRDVMRETRICLDNLSQFINRYIAWLMSVVDQLRKHKGTCPAVALANSTKQYSTLQRNFSQMVADLDSLASAYNNAASTDPSMCAEFAFSLSRRMLDDFQQRDAHREGE